MNATRSAAALMQDLRLTVVRRSSSMMPTLTVLRFMPSRSSTWLKISAAKATSSGPCIFGLTMYTLPLRVFLRLVLPLRLCRAIRLVNSPSWIPSGISLPWASRIAGLVIRWPTLRTNSSERPCRVTLPPLGAAYSRSGFMVRVKVLPPLLTLSARSPFIRPSQLR
ncbi:hypothetical protein D3C76_961280 [compost metagenome]